MIDLKKQEKVKQEIHQALERSVDRSGQAREEIIKENRIFAILCHDFDIGPTKCAIRMNEEYDYDLTGDEVIQIFRNRRIANPHERKELLQWADEVAELCIGGISGKKDVYLEFNVKRKSASLKNGKRHDSQERMAAIMLYEKYPEIALGHDVYRLHLLGNTLAKYFFYDVADAIGEVYGFPQYYGGKRKERQSSQPEKKISYEQALKKIDQLENILDRTNIMLQDLQEEFEEQLEASKVKELADFFAKLNSEKYGCILDELLVVRKGIDELRKNNYEVPIEINGLLIMVKKLIQFVRDSHIDPIMKIHSIHEVKAADIEFYNYEGTPFRSPDVKKTVKVISPGWIYKDKELQISRPKVKEVE